MMHAARATAFHRRSAVRAKPFARFI
jgi:hypothetical protein